MKKWVFWTVIVLLHGYEAVHSNKYPSAPDGEGQPVQVMTADNGRDHLAVISKQQIYQGDLLLINKEYPVHKAGVLSDVVKLSQHQELVQGYGLLDNSVRLSERVAEQFSAMIKDAAGQGVDHFLISSGYRDKAEQERLYKEKGSDYALPPGYSEHNLGLSLDIGSTEMEMNRAPEGKWLQAYAWDYGFILRYPADKTDITGIRYEPWHFRYVGLPHSLIMRDKNLTLEEYLEFLKQQQAITTTVKGRTYQISYVAVSGNTAFPVPEGHRYELSGNNNDGVIVTVLP